MGTTQVIFVVVERGGGATEVIACACATGSDVTESGPDRKSPRAHAQRYFLYYYYSSSTKCVIAHDR